MNKSLPIITPPEAKFDDGESRDPFSPYRITKWRSHPTMSCHACLGGEDFHDHDEAMRSFETDDTNYHVRYFLFVGPGKYYIRTNKFYDPQRVAQSDDGIGHETWFKEGEELAELAPHYP